MVALGTFALVTNREQLEPQQLVQLAVNRDGIVSGTLFNKENDEAFAIQGRVDKETQRVAFPCRYPGSSGLWRLVSTT